MLSSMPHTTTSLFPRSDPDAITSIDQACRSTTYQTSYDLVQAVLRAALLDMARSAHDLHGIDRVEFGACAELYALLTAHPIDVRGRCWSCRRPGWLRRRPRVCMVYQKAHYWLRQPTHLLQVHLASELGVDPQSPAHHRPGTAQ
jgi:hypothetical protein